MDNSLGQIIAALMASSSRGPQVTPMGAAPSMGGGGRGPSARKGSGLNLSMPAQPQQPLTKFNDMPIASPAGMSGDPNQPQMAGPTTGGGAMGMVMDEPVDTTPLAVQLYEARAEVHQLERPRGIRESWRAGKELPAARRRLAQAELNVQEYNKAQGAIQHQRAVQTIAAEAESLWGPEEAMRITQIAYSNPDQIGPISEKMMETRRVRDERIAGYVREDYKESFDSAEMMNALQNAYPDADPAVLSGLAQTDSSFKELSDWLDKSREGEAEDLKSVQRNIDQNQTQQLITQQVSAIRKNMEESMTPTTGFGGAVVRKFSRMLDEPTGEGEIGLFESFMPAGEVARRNEVIKNNIGLAAINNMRQFSPSGGALGNVSNFEVRMVQNVKDALDPTRDAEEYMTALDTVEMIQKRSAYLSRHGEDMMARAIELGKKPETFIMDQLNSQFPIDEAFTKGILDEETGWDGLSTAPPMQQAPATQSGWSITPVSGG